MATFRLTVSRRRTREPGTYAFIDRGDGDDSRQLNEYLRTAMAETTGIPCQIFSQQLEMIHHLRADLFTGWANTPTGEKLAIVFPAECGEPN